MRVVFAPARTVVSGNISGFIYILTILIISSHLAPGSHVDLQDDKRPRYAR